MFALCFNVIDLTAVCLLEGFNNPDWMVHADRVLKSIGKEKASEHFKVTIHLNTVSNDIEINHLGSLKLRL